MLIFVVVVVVVVVVILVRRPYVSVLEQVRYVDHKLRIIVDTLRR